MRQKIVRQHLATYFIGPTSFQVSTSTNFQLISRDSVYQHDEVLKQQGLGLQCHMVSRSRPNAADLLAVHPAGPDKMAGNPSRESKEETVCCQLPNHVHPKYIMRSPEFSSRFHRMFGRDL